MFEISKYIEREELPKDENVEITEQPEENLPKGTTVSKIIKIESVGDEALSGIIAKALFEALKKDDINIVPINNKTRNDIFKNVKVVSTESINNSGGELKQLEDGDIVLSDIKLPTTPVERMLDFRIDDHKGTHYRSVEKLREYINNELRLEATTFFLTEDDRVVKHDSVVTYLDSLKVGQVFSHSELGEGSFIMIYSDCDCCVYKNQDNKYDIRVTTFESINKGEL